MAYSTCMLQVCGPHGVVKSIAFDKRPLAKQVEGICDAFGVNADGDDSYFLTRGVSADTLPIRSEAELLALPEQTEIGLHSGADVTQARLSAIQTASATDVIAELQNFSATVRADAALAEEAVSRDGIHTILEAIGGPADSPRSQNVEPAAVSLCELLRYDFAADWLDEHQEELGAEFFGQLLSALFPRSNETSEHLDNPKRPPRCSLEVLLFLLHRFPKCAAAVHEAAEGLVYKQIVEVIVQAADEFQVGAACSVLSAMTRASARDESLQQRIREGLLAHASDAEEDTIALKSVIGDCSEERYAEQLLLMCMDSSTELSAERASGERCDRLLEEVQRLRHKHQREKNTEDMLRKEVRRLHRAMCVMVNFVKVDSCLMVEKNLPAIVKKGWDSIQWTKGYSMLHYVCQCVDDTSVVELVASLTNDLERRDEEGKRPIDYARENKNPNIAASFDRLRRKQVPHLPRTTKIVATGNSGAVAAKDTVVPAPALRQGLDQLEGLSGKLKKCIEVVLDKSWERVTWPGGYNALHLAACQGHVGAIRLLVSAGADVNSEDDRGMKPIDYAKEQKKMDAIAALDKLATSNETAKAAKYSNSSAAGAARQRLSTYTREQVDEHPLLDAVPWKLRQICEHVAEKGWQNIQWKQNFTALHTAANAGSVEAVQFLLDAKASVALSVADENGLTPLGHAEKKGHESVIALLKLQSSGSPTKPEQPTTPSKSSTASEEPATPSIADPELEPLAQPPSSVDATAERGHQQRRDEHEMNLAEVRAELDRVKAENKELQEERKKREQSAPALTTFVQEDEALKYVDQLQLFGHDAVLAKLQEDRLSGGLALAETDAAQVIKQLELIGRVHTSLSSKTASKQAPARPSEAPAQPMSSPSAAPVQPSSRPSQAPLQDNVQASAPAPAKGKGKGPKGPAPKAKSKGKGDPGFEPRKPKLETRVPMKPVWWTRYLEGADEAASETIWSGVEDLRDLVPTDDLENYYSKNAVGSDANESALQEPGQAKKDKFIRIIKDPQLVVGKVKALREFQNADTVCQAILELDETVLSLEGLKSLIDHACPSPEQIAALKKAREACRDWKPQKCPCPTPCEDEDLPLALPEHFMWKISQVDKYKVRLDCWHFVRSFEARAADLAEGLRKFAVIVNACRSSKALSSFLAIVLAFGNFCNAGTDRGQADGIDLKGIQKFEEVKGCNKKDLRHPLLQVYLQKMKSQADEFFTEFRPLFDNIFRTIVKDSDGAEKISKKVDVTLEDYDKEVTAMNVEFEENEKKMREMLQYNEDPADQFKLQMPELFDNAQTNMKGLIEQSKNTKQEYLDLLKWLKTKEMPSSEFCCLLDDFFVPEIHFVGKPAAFKNTFLIPTFCKDPTSEAFQPLSVESLLVLWGFQRRESLKPSATKPRGNRKQQKKAKLASAGWAKVRTSIAAAAAFRAKQMSAAAL